MNSQEDVMSGIRKSKILKVTKITLGKKETIVVIYILV
jgi:hypothetical protein